ncbi:MAG: hypothetical protein WC292_04115 [Clostridia bacterium]
MTAIRLTLARGEERIENYILSRLETCNETSVKITRHKKFIFIDISAKNDIFAEVRDIISSVILVFYKYDYLKENITAIDEYKMEHYALMGALLNFDEEQEKFIVEKGLENRADYSINSIFEFRCSRLKESWKNIALLANRLLSQCDGEEDIYDLVFFLIAIDSELSPRVRISGELDRIILFSNSTEIPLPALSGDISADILIAAIRERPSSIVISDCDIISKELLQAIKKLGNGF